MNPTPAMLLAAVLATAVTGCGGGSVADRTGETPRVPPPGAPPASTIELAGLDYADARQAPIVAREGTYLVGAPVAVAAARLDGRAVHAAVTVRHGAVRDAAQAGDIVDYLEAASPLRPQITMARPLHQPFVSLAPNARSTLVPYVARAIQIVNGALPHEHRIRFSSDPGPAFEAGLDAGAPGEIPIAFGYLPPDVGGITEQGQEDGRVTWSYIRLNREKTYDPIAEAPTAQARQEAVDRLVHVIAHELVHGLGLLGHPDPERYPDSALGPRLRLNPGAVLFPIDRDVLVASHTIVRTIGTREKVVTDLGPWNRASTHLMGELDTEGGTVTFGVRSRHGFHEPWFEGRAPGQDLADNRTLGGNATWRGRLLGRTAASDAVAGSATLDVELASLSGSLGFSALEMWTDAPPGAPGTGMPWTHETLDYTIGITGNRFIQTGGADGTVTGVFAGPNHEGMGGVLERTDLTASFAGQR